MKEGDELDSEEDEDDQKLFYVGKGMCKVFVRDASNKEVMVKELYEGDHFGEIAIIYKCRRTATVQSMNYNTFAVMTPLAYRRLI